MTAVLGNQAKIHEVLRRIGLKRTAGGPLTAHPNGNPSGLLVASAFGTGRPTASVGMMSTSSEAKKPKLDPSICMVSSPCLTASVPAASIAAVAAQQATAANLRAAAAAVAAAAVSFPGPASTSSASTSSEATPSENHAASTSANPNGTNSNAAPSDPPFSRVVHLRNIPSDMTELELVHFCLPFGKLINYLMLKGKNQAFVEYQDDAGAATIVNVAQACPMAIRGRTIFCQYSTHQELKTERKGACKNGSIFGDSMLSSNLLVLSNATNNQPPSNSLSPAASTTPATSAPANSASQLDISTQQAPNAVLRVIIDSMIYPVTLDVLHTIFSRYGKVLRIITFNKNNTFQALVQLSEANAAQQARSQLDGQNVYNNCCTLRIDYSKLSTLNVKYNNDKSRDYTNPTLPSGEMTLEQQLSLISAAAGQGQQAASLGALAPGVFPFMAGAGGQLAFAQQALANEGLGVNPALAPFLGQLSGALQPGVVATGGAPPSVAGMPFNAINLLGITPVVLVSNLNEHKVTPDALFTLFGVYGDVQRVKILFNKKDNALIQYAEPQQAQHAIQHLDKVRWFDRMIRVTSSKHSNVQMPKEGQPDAGLTRDYTNSTLHRFKKPGSKNYMNIYPPSSTLHLSNIPPNVSEEFLRAAFEEKKFNVTEFKFFQRDHKMALVQLADVEQAINALVEMHNFKLADNAHLRVSFSKKGINL